MVESGSLSAKQDWPASLFIKSSLCMLAAYSFKLDGHGTSLIRGMPKKLRGVSIFDPRPLLGFLI